MNERSSRAHSLFILSLKQRDASADITVRSQLYLADLGGSDGSERVAVVLQCVHQTSKKHQERINILNQYVVDAFLVFFTGLMTLL